MKSPSVPLFQRGEIRKWILFPSLAKRGWEILGNHGVNIKSPLPPLGKGETWIING